MAHHDYIEGSIKLNHPNGTEVVAWEISETLAEQILGDLNQDPMTLIEAFKADYRERLVETRKEVLGEKRPAASRERRRRRIGVSLMAIVSDYLQRTNDPFFILRRQDRARIVLRYREIGAGSPCAFTGHTNSILARSGDSWHGGRCPWLGFVGHSV